MSMKLDQAMIRTPMTWPLRVMIAAITAVAGLALAAGLALGVGAAQLDQGLRGQMTIEIPPDDKGRVDPALTAAIRKDLSAMPGVSAEPLRREQIARLLQPWLGAEAAADLDALPLPQLLDVKVDDDNAGTRIAAMMRQKYPEVAVADHQAWLNDLSRALRRFAAVAIIIGAALFAALFSTVIFACRAGLAVQRPMIELLHLIGATGGYIGREMRRYAWRLVWPGCAVGLIAAILIGAMAANMAGHLAPTGLAATPGILWLGIGGLIAGLPMLIMILTAVSAFWATRQMLRTMP